MKKTLKFTAISVLSLTAAGLWLAGLFHISNLWRGDSDNAFLVIAGNSILKGNYFLKGWYLSSFVSYFPVDIYLNALSIKILGFRPLIIHIVPLFIFIVFIAVSYLYVKDANKERTAFKIAVLMLIAFFAMPGRAFAFWTLQELHLSAVVLSMCVFLLFNKSLKYFEAGKKTLSFVYLSIAFPVSAITVLNDGIGFLICIAPLVIVILLFIYKNKSDTNIKRSHAWYFSAILFIAAAVALREAALFLITKNGGFMLAPSGLPVAFARLRDIQKNIYLYFHGFFELLGVNFFGKQLFSFKTLAGLFKIIGLIIFVWGIVITAKKIKKLNSRNFIDISLLTGIALMTGAFLLSDIAISKASARYLVPVVVFGFLLAFRNIPGTDLVRKKYGGTGFNLLISLIVIVYAGSFIYTSMAVIPQSPFKPLSRWLIEHNLKYGYGDYFDAGIVTLMSKNKIKVRQVTAPSSKITQYKWVSRRKWYNKNAYFVIYSEHFIYGGIDKESIVKTFGKPSKVYVEDFQGSIGKAYGRPDGKYTMPPYVIMVYKKGIKIY